VVNKRIIWKDAEGDDKRASFQSRAIRELGGTNVGREWLCGGTVDTCDPVSTSCGLGEGATRGSRKHNAQSFRELTKSVCS